MFRIIMTTLALVCVSWGGQAAAEEQFARVGSQTISMSEFTQAFNQAVRYKFYHGEVPKGELDAFRKQVARDLIEQTVLLEEADRLGIKADPNRIKAELQKFEQRYRISRGAEGLDEGTRKTVIERIAAREKLLLLEERIKDLPEPDDAAVRAFYEANPAKFTEPERIAVSMIMLKVPPSATSSVWASRKKELEALRFRIMNGESFEALAREFSEDATGALGGRMGYLHQGMLADVAEAALKEVDKGELTPVLTLLEGVALFRLDDRVPASLQPFEKVQNRARNLLIKTRKEDAWAQFRSDVVKRADIEVFQPELMDTSE